MTSPNWPNTAWQSETAGLAKDGYQYIAYNAEDTDTTHVTYPQRVERDAQNRPFVDRVVCPGTSAVGRSMMDTNNAAWVTRRMPLPAGWAVLWGDPALSIFDGMSWISALASPSDYFATRANVTVGGKSCYRTSNYAGSKLPSGFGDADLTPLAGACVQGTTLKTVNAPSSVSCFRRNNGVASATGTDFLDGGSLASCASAIYAAYEDTKTHTVAMYRRAAGQAWAAVAGDSAIPATDHPVLLEASSYTGVWMITANHSALSVRYHTTAGFGPVTSIANDYSSADVTISGGATIRRGRAVAGVVAPNPSALTPATWIAYESESVSPNGQVRRKQINIMRCTTTCTFITRVGGLDPLTNRGPNAFLPAMAFTYKLVNNVATPVVGFSYMTDEGQIGNKVVLKYYAFNINGTVRGGGSLTVPQIACPGAGAVYWSDYDSMYVMNNATASPSFHRSFTDSTEAVCDTTTRANLDYRSQNQHVSNASIAVP